MDPGELAGTRRNAKEPLVVQVLDELNPVLEEGNREFASAQPPTTEDLDAAPTDYVVGADDLLEVTIYDLEGPGLQTIKRTRVSGTGNITLPYLPSVVRAEGLTEIEAQTAIIDAYRKGGVLENAQVSVSVGEARGRAFTIQGSVARPGPYLISDQDFRILDALAAAGDVPSPYVEDLFVIRRTDEVGGADRMAPGAGEAPATAPANDAQPGTDPLAPQSDSGHVFKALKKSVLLRAQADPLAPDDAAAPAPAPTDAAPAAEAPAAVVPDGDDPGARVGRIDGQDVVVQPVDAAATVPAMEEVDLPPSSGKQFEFNDLPMPDNIRVIRIPLAKLRAGELQYNIPVRPRDRIIVPPGQIGFYYMEGHVTRPGPYTFSGPKVTLTQAISSASGLDGLAIPQRTDIIRRIGPNKVMFYRVNLARIAAGESPDIFLKPNDQVRVGTNFLAPFFASIRGGFRMTYGFGFLYDRNFAYSQDSQNR